ncbi:MAG: NlpC/P60 family protein [Bacteroidetes bacterium]|nr:NlpC/P60 family protein [Bacteroidota bacterium]MCY4234243.1 NlpC/P60 family protein [Bacteroidota bacterium]
MTSVIPSAATESELRTFASQWQGVPHLSGGDSKSGIDAPGLVMVAFDQVLGLSLPHSTPRQLGYGEEVELALLKPGDLVFFRPTSMPRHVGIYLGSQEFLHSWPETGVSMSRLDDPFWSGAFWAGRRLLASQSSVVSPDSTSQTPSNRPNSRRVGW